MTNAVLSFTDATRTEPAAYRPKQAAQQLGIGLATLYRRIKAGDIHATKFGGATLISRIEIERITNPAQAIVR